MNKSAIIGIVAVIILGVGGYLVFLKSPSKTPANQASTSSNNTDSTPASSSDQNSSNTITYGDNGFSPSTLTVKAGTTITIKNTSSSELQFNSNPHPVHTDDAELNVGTVAAGQSATLTPTTTGTHSYHNHLNSSQTGTLIVQ